MATVASKLQALESQRQAIIAACIDCGYDVDEDATLYEAFQVLNADTEAGIVMGTSNTPIVKLQKLHEAFIALVNYAFDAQLTNSATFAQIAGAIEPANNEPTLYALLLRTATSNRYDMVFVNSTRTLTEGGTYNGRNIFKAYTGMEAATYSFNGTPWNAYKDKILSVNFVDGFNPVSCAFLFAGFSLCTTISGLDKLDTAGVKNFRNMFQGCNVVQSLDVDGFDMSDAENLSYMFSNCRVITELNIEDWDVSSVQYFTSMFVSCLNLEELDLSRWDGHSAYDISGMFSSCSSLELIHMPSWGSARPGNIYSLFSNCSSLVEADVSGINLANVYNINSMFNGCSNLEVIYADETANWSSKSGTNVFTGCVKLVGGEGTVYDSGNVGQTYARIDGLGNQAGYFTVKRDFSGNAYAVMIPDSGSKYELRFLRATTAPLAGDTYMNKTVAYVFSGFESTVYNSNSQVPWYTHHANITSVHFDGWVKPRTCAYWFYWQTACTSYDLAKLDTSIATSFTFMFYSCTALTSLNMTKQKTGNVTSINYMFYNCTALATLLTGAWDMTKLDVLAQAFRNMTSITELDFSRWTMPEYTSTMQYMFYNCNKLVTIYVPPGTDLSDTAVGGYCFSQCSKLVGGNGTTYSSANVTADMAKVDGLGNAAGYFTAKTN